MRELEFYINAIVAGLGIGNQQKEELADEFRDHLELLKAEYMQKGFSEGESMKQAMERFGDSGKLNKMLQKSAGFRNWSNFFFGAAITFVLLIFCYLPMYGLIVATRGYPAAIVLDLLITDFRGLLGFLTLFIPIGYFLPIVFRRASWPVPLVVAFSIFGILAGVYCSIAVTHYINLIFPLACGAAVLLGGMTGYLLLLGVNKLLSHPLRKEKLPN